MRSTRILVSTALVVGLLPLFGGTPSWAAASSSPKASIGLLRHGGDLPQMGAPSRYGYVILNAWEHGYIEGLKAANPQIKVLVYKDMAACKYSTGMDSAGTSFYSVGVGCQEASSSHPEWFLTETSGDRIEWCDYPGNWFMDVGSSSYREAWAANVLSDLQGYGWDGVLVDDTMYSPRYHLCGRTIAAYPDDTSFAAATEGFLAQVGPRLTSAGFEVIPNISDASPSVFGRWVGYSSGAMKEWWVKDNNRVRSDPDWSYEQAYLDVTTAQDKSFLAVTYGSMGDVSLMRYARASFLLGWSGTTGTLIYHAGTGVDPHSEEWTIEVGMPTGDRYPVGPAWRRDFTEGTAIVNPSSSSIARVDLDGRYMKPNGRAVDAIMLEPMSGVVLRSIGDPIHLKVDRHEKQWTARVKLRWKGASSSKVKVMRNGRAIETTANDRRYVDTVRNHRKRLHYRVCEVGTSKCSKRVKTRA
jgi:hypothetical protein